MSDQPTSPVPPEGHDNGVNQRLQQITRRLNEVMQLMRSQREQLRQKGMSLPSSAMDNLRKLKSRADGVARDVTDANMELRSLRALAETTALINSSQTTDEVLNQVMDTVISLTGAERGYIMLRNETTGELEFQVARGMDQQQLDSKKEMIVSRSIVTGVAESGEPVLTDNASQDARFEDQASVVSFALRSILAVPLKVRDDVIGVVYCDNRIHSGLFKPRDLEMLNSFANQAAVAIENARLFEDTRARLQQVTEIRDLMDNIFTSISSGVITTSPEGDIIVSNLAAEAIIGQEDLAGQHLEDALDPVLGDSEAADLFWDALNRVNAEGTTELLELDTLDFGRGPRHWYVIASPLRDDGGDTYGLTIVLDDMTEQKQHERQLEQVRRYLPVALVDNIRDVNEIDTGGQERTITALAADVRGFTTFSERLDPDELMAVINKYLSLASDAINLYEGIVDKYLGDAVTGLWNTNLNPQDDHAIRAVQAALNLILDLHAQHDVLPEEQRLFYGIGIHTGPAVLGDVGGEVRREFAAMGEAMEISKYLESNAGPGEVVVSEATYEIVKDTFECEAITELRRPKAGYEHVNPVYRVLRRKKGAKTGQLLFDPELADMLSDLQDLE